MSEAGGGIILCADDFAMSPAISDAIVTLAEAGRLSATGAMTNLPGWRGMGATARGLRRHIALGLHLNLTFGAPAGAMPKLAPDGDLPGIDRLMGRALSRTLDLGEIRGEIARQLDRFEDEAGVPPDFVDGHHHAHALPGVRDALMDELAARYRGRPLMVRDPADRLRAILARKVAAGKALVVALLATGLRPRIAAAGFAANDGFAGFSTFGAIPYADEFARFLVAPGPRPMIMCHPGQDDPGAEANDEIAARRPEEYAVLASRDGLPAMLWRPARATDDAPAFAPQAAGAAA